MNTARIAAIANASSPASHPAPAPWPAASSPAAVPASVVAGVSLASKNALNEKAIAITITDNAIWLASEKFNAKKHFQAVDCYWLVEENLFCLFTRMRVVLGLFLFSKARAVLL